MINIYVDGDVMKALAELKRDNEIVSIKKDGVGGK